jgi:RNA polymerase sigma-70 factor (ECF subfamily)
MQDPSVPVVDGPGATGPAMDAATLWADFAPPLRRFLARRVPPGVDADDLVQDVFVRVVRNLGTLRSTERPEAWLFQIARNALRDALRVRLRRDGRTDPLETDVIDDAGPDVDQAAAADLAPCLAGMIGRLPEPYRTAIARTSLQGVTQTAAARDAGISISGMKSRVQRGRDQLREMLVGCCAIAVDVRGGVSDFQQRGPGACGGATAAAATGARVEGRCCTPGASRASEA